MSASTSLAVSVDEYLNTDWVPRCEYIDGVLRPKAMGTNKHSRMQGKLFTAIEARGWNARVELTVNVSPTRFLVPDVAAHPDPMPDPYPEKPLALCIEILSPGDRVSAALAKCEEYHEWGVPFCWVVDPVEVRAWIYNAGSVPESVVAGGLLRAGDLEVELEALYL